MLMWQVKALEAALAAKQAEEGRAQEKAARQRQQLEQQQQAKARTAASTTAAEGVPAVVGTKPQGKPLQTSQALLASAMRQLPVRDGCSGACIARGSPRKESASAPVKPALQEHTAPLKHGSAVLRLFVAYTL